jgi:hypothetical protein
MARFQNGIWQGNEISIRPIGKRRFFGWSSPYQSGDKVIFEIEITKGTTSTSLYELPLHVYNVALNQQNQIRFPNNGSKKAIVDKFSTSSADALEFWVGIPLSSHSVQVVYADTWNPSTTIIAILSALLGAILSALILGT